MALGNPNWQIEEALVKEALRALPDASTGNSKVKLLTSKLENLLNEACIWNHSDLGDLVELLNSYAMDYPSSMALLGTSPIDSDLVTDQMLELDAVSSLVLLSASLRALCLSVGQHGSTGFKS